ncbi:MAG: translation initiation factor IF-5A [Candidatus Diapherotrites archaeon]|uniref:Translation initiation factor 5A n=1 Tax=Candidatus Iainarchaeum sp. TaxID=3101447 RepID=A0A7J4ITT3_9ARCH|nr:MAG: translation initiation factor 5A [archaeon GW2011_AR10]MBS3059038.1 translation initiation factor IF-5A [Candidatus Diapherotrites archaeon]HIH08893.1 translation initiation factor IF-5A [Candidatus Diapherotrites archaeon]
MDEGEKRFAQAGHLKPGSYVLIDSFPCQVKSTEKSKPGKHGAAKVRVVAMGVFDNQKRNLLKPADADVEVPIIEKKSAQVVAVMGETIQLMNVESYETFDIPKPKEIVGLQGGVEVEYHKWGNYIRVVRKK